MATFDFDPPEPARPTVVRTAKHADELNKLGRSWFAEAREQSEREEAEVETWRREHNKWLAFNRRSTFATDFDDPPSGKGGQRSD
jgi:hypothetical protein